MTTVYRTFCVNYQLKTMVNKLNQQRQDKDSAKKTNSIIMYIMFNADITKLIIYKIQTEFCSSN